MAGLANLKTIFSGNDGTDGFLDWPEENSGTGLRTALDAARRKIELSERIKERALSSEIEHALEVELERTLEIELEGVNMPKNGDSTMKQECAAKKQGKKQRCAAKPERVARDIPEGISEDPVADTEDFTIQSSEILLELKRKQDSVHQVRGQIKSGATLLEGLAKQSEQLSEYLGRAEVEIASLEETKAKYVKLSSVSQALAKEHRDLKEKLTERTKKIAILENSKQKDRATITEAKSNLSKFEEQLRARQSELQSREIIISRLKDQNLSLIEKVELVKEEKARVQEDLTDVHSRVEELEHDLGESEKRNSALVLQNETLADENGQAAIDLMDVQSRYAKVSNALADMKSEVEDLNFQLTSERSDFDEKVRLKDNRISELERENQLLTRQVCITENLVADLSEDKGASIADLGLDSDLDPVPTPRKRKTKASGNGAAVAAE